MKKVLPVVFVLIMFLLSCTAQNSSAQKDPFEIGKEMAMTGKSSPPVWAKYAGSFGVTYNSELNAVAFIEKPESGNGTAVWWVKELGPKTYSRFTFIVKDYEVQEEGMQNVPITQEKAEQEAWRILGHFDYSK